MRHLGAIRSHAVRALACAAATVALAADASAHVVVDGPGGPAQGDAAWYFLRQGFAHIIPLGLDHILFILALYLLRPGLKPIVRQATVFTIAHSITLGLAMYGMVPVAPRIVEPLIALSIVFVALGNIVRPRSGADRLVLVFLFGLLHGLGFAGALRQIGLPADHFPTALLAFNAGVELGQLAVIALAYLLFGRWFSQAPWYRQRIVVPLSACIALVAGCWTLERMLPSA